MAKKTRLTTEDKDLLVASIDDAVSDEDFAELLFNDSNYSHYKGWQSKYIIDGEIDIDNVGYKKAFIDTGFMLFEAESKLEIPECQNCDGVGTIENPDFDEDDEDSEEEEEIECEDCNGTGKDEDDTSSSTPWEFTEETIKELDDLAKKGWSVPCTPVDEEVKSVKAIGWFRSWGSLTQTYILTRKLSASEVKLRKNWLNKEFKTYISSKKFGL